MNNSTTHKKDRTIKRTLSLLLAGLMMLGLFGTLPLYGCSGGDTTPVATPGKDALQNVTSSLEDYFYLDDLAVGENAKVLLTVGLDGETQGNSYQNTFAELQMNFAVENGETKKIVQAPHTGDSTQMGMYGMVALVAGLGCMLLLFFRLKDGRKAQAEKEGR